MKGYSGMYVVKAITEKIGKTDPMASPLRCTAQRSPVKDHPVLLDVTSTRTATDRESGQSRKRKQVVTATSPPASAK
jgi:hypothetical protein